MAEVAVKKVPEQQSNAEKNAQQANPEKNVQQTGQQGHIAQQGGPTGLSRERLWDSFPSWSPAEFFSNPFAVMRRFSDDMDRSFGRFFGREGGHGFWSPAIEVSQHEGQLKVHAELPGLKPEEVRVEIANDQLVIQGERKSEQEEKNKGYYRSERRYGQFYRAIPLPEGADTENAKAQFNNGVLEVTLPVAEPKSNRRQIRIESK